VARRVDVRTDYCGHVMERRGIEVRGIVQGVGFRPFVYTLAARHRLTGFVRNRTGVVAIEVEGESPDLDQFLTDLVGQPPPLAQIDGVDWGVIPPAAKTTSRSVSANPGPGTRSSSRPTRRPVRGASPN